MGREPYTILGVVSSSFWFEGSPDLYLPFQADPNSAEQAHFFRAAGRLKPGVTVENADAALKLAAEELNTMSC